LLSQRHAFQRRHFAHRHAFGGDERDVAHAKEAQHLAQVRRHGVGRGAFGLAATRRQHEYLLTLDEALRHAFRRITERDAGTRQVIQIALELRGQIEVVDGHRENDAVRFHQFSNERIAEFHDALLLDAASIRRSEQRAGRVAVEIGNGLRADVADLDGCGRVGCLDARNQVIGQLLAVGTVAENRGKDNEGLHCKYLQWWPAMRGRPGSVSATPDHSRRSDWSLAPGGVGRSRVHGLTVDRFIVHINRGMMNCSFQR